MLYVDSASGLILHPKIQVNHIARIEHGDLTGYNGIVIHQTDTSTTKSALNSFKNDPKKVGAHFIIEKNGQIIQTMSLHKQAYHVGTMLARCEIEGCCIRPPGMTNLQISSREKAKSFPYRFPSNSDSIGIELIGKCEPLKPGEKAPGPGDTCRFETATADQNKSVTWLVDQLCLKYNIKKSEVYYHPEIARKNLSEAVTATKGTP